MLSAEIRLARRRLKAQDSDLDIAFRLAIALNDYELVWCSTRAERLS